MAPRRRRAAARRARAPRTAKAPASTAPPPAAAPMRLEEPPHTHIVCRNCGRITAVDLQLEERELLVALAARRPDNWSVDGVSFSVTGLCPTCRLTIGP